CFWLLSCLDETFSLYDATMQASSAFPYVVRLKSCDADQLESVIRSRQSLAGLPVQFPQSRRPIFWNRLRGRTLAHQSYRDLSKKSGGSLRRALAVWLDHAHSGNEGVTVMAPLHTSVPLG